MEYSTLASKNSIEKTIKALATHNIEAILVKNGAEALTLIKKLIPDEASVMNGSSTTLEQIGYFEFLESGNHKWNDLHKKISEENDKEKRSKLRKESVTSDFYLGSVHALTETGEFVVASNTGSQLPHIVYTSSNLIFIVSTKKIVSTLSEAMERLEKHVYPLEDKRALIAYGSGTSINKIVIFKNENPHSGRKIRMILVEEDLGF